MICYNRYGKMTPEFKEYQQETWDKFRNLAEEITKKAIKDGVCPQGMLGTMRVAVECGTTIACAHSYCNDYAENGPGWLHPESK